MPVDGHWQRLEALFDGALEVPESQRARWLDSMCPSDPGLRAEVERMLDAHRRGGGVLDRPAITPHALGEHLNRALGNRYEIERELGRGGAAMVFLAHETKHERRVVFKVLKPEVAAACGTERFVREVRIAARLAHPHIIGLIDSGDADGLLYYVMPYVEGETLRARLARYGPLRSPQALPMLRDVASALAHAHAAGVVHRDLKPENVLCVGDHVFLLDFGVAKVLSHLVEDAELTRQGVSIGTPAYMSPEQRDANTHLDQRTDVYAWGLLAYELLTGRLPDGDGWGKRAARDLAAARPDVPDAVTALVGRALEIDPASRPADGAELLATLGSVTTPAEGMVPLIPAATTPARGAVPVRQWSLAGSEVLVPATRRSRRTMLLGAGGILALLAAGGTYLASGEDPDASASRARLPSPIVVAALANETGDPALDSWGRMAADWITQGLQETGVVGVVSWPSARLASDRIFAERAAGRVVDPVAVMRNETGAETVVTGSYYLIGDSLQFRVEVSDARGRQLVGAPPPVAASRDSAHIAIRTLRDRLMTAVTVWADSQVWSDPDLARKPPTFAAYQAYDRAMQRFLAQEYTEAAPEFLSAYALDTSFVLPLLYAATARWNQSRFAEADSLVRVVLSRPRELSTYHRGWAEFMEASYAGDGERARAAIQRAAEQAPGSRAWYNLATVALDTDRPEEAIDALNHLDPDRGDMRGWSSYWTQLTYALHLLDRHDRELAAARQVRARFPDRRVGLVLEARALGALGRTAELDSLILASLPLPPTTYWSQGAAMVVAGEELVAHVDSLTGRAYLERGVAWLREQLALHPTERGHRYWLASALYDLGRWSESELVWATLVRDLPERMQNHGMRALAAARQGRPAEALLPPPDGRQRGEHAAYRARLAAIAGDQPRAASLFADAVLLGVDDLPWLHASAHNDLSLLGSVRQSLPTSLRIERRRSER